MHSGAESFLAGTASCRIETEDERIAWFVAIATVPAIVNVGVAYITRDRFTETIEISDARWAEFFKVASDQGVYPKSLDYKKAYTLQFVGGTK